MNSRDRQIGESYKDYAARMAGEARAAEIDRDRLAKQNDDGRALLAEIALAAGYAGDPSRGLVEHVAALHGAALHPSETDGPLHEVDCPQCGATIRARMSDHDYLSGPYPSLAEMLDRLVMERGSFAAVTADDLSEVQAALVAPSETDGGEHRG